MTYVCTWVAMPDIRIYVRNEAYTALLKECHGNLTLAARKIAEMVNEKYGPKRV